VRCLIVLNILCTIVKVFGSIEIPGIQVIENPGCNFAKLSPVELTWLPVALNEPAFSRDELIQKLGAKKVVQRRTQLEQKSALINQGHGELASLP
jgi:hypothetical protein